MDKLCKVGIKVIGSLIKNKPTKGKPKCPIILHFLMVGIQKVIFLRIHLIGEIIFYLN